MWCNGRSSPSPLFTAFCLTTTALCVAAPSSLAAVQTAERTDSPASTSASRAASPVVARDGAPAAGRTPSSAADTVGAPSSAADTVIVLPLPGAGLFRSPDYAYAGTFLGMLALVEPLEGLDSAAGRAADRDGVGMDASLASVGGLAGDLRVDLGLAAATLLAGQLVGSPGTRRLGFRMLEGLVAADAMATLFKVGVGRRRPTSTTESDQFDPFSTSSEYASFPSGHAAHAFALAATLSRELRHVPWVPYVAYPAATLVAASRVAGGKHWPTDVVAGAALGLFSARLVGRIHGEVDEARVEPVLRTTEEGSLFLGVAVAVR